MITNYLYTSHDFISRFFCKPIFTRYNMNKLFSCMAYLSIYT